MRISRERCVAVVLTSFLILLSCNGGSGGGSTQISPQKNIDMQGKWKGETSFDGSKANETLWLTQEGNNLSGSLFTFPKSSSPFFWPDVNGTINGSSINDLSAIIKGPDNNSESQFIELEFIGNVSENTFSGNCKVHVNSQTVKEGTFSFSKADDSVNTPTNPANPVNNPQCFNDYSKCVFNCQSDSSCKLNCIKKYNSCSQGQPTNPDPGNNNLRCMTNCNSTWLSCDSSCRAGVLKDPVKEKYCYLECQQNREKCEAECKR